MMGQGQFDNMISYSNYWYALFVMTGYEEVVERQISKYYSCDCIKPFIPTVERIYKRRETSFKEYKKLFPGYVFIETSMMPIEFYSLFKRFVCASKHVICILSYGDSQERAIRNEERSRLEAFFDSQERCYCIGISEGILIENKVKIRKGPLLNKDDQIKRVFKTRMEADVEVDFLGKKYLLRVGLSIQEDSQEELDDGDKQ